MLTKVEIHNFRSCWDVTIDGIGPTLVLVGRNGSGKTNILRAISGVASFASGGADDPPKREILSSPDSRYGLEFTLDETRYRYEMACLHPTGGPWIQLEESLSVMDDPRGTRVLASRRGTDVEVSGHRPRGIGPSGALLPFLLAYPPPDDPFDGRLPSLAGFLGGVRYYPLDEANEARKNNIIRQKDYLAWRAGGPPPPEDAELLQYLLLDLHDRDRDTFEELAALLGDNGLGLIAEVLIQSNDVDGHGPGESFRVVAFRPSQGLGGNGRGLPFGDLSLGTRRVIRLLLALLRDRSSVMLIEHPEDTLHRWLTTRIFSILKTYSDPTQVIAASHSDEVFDQLRPEEVRIVAIEEGRTVVHALGIEEIERARRYMKEAGSFSDYLQTMHDV